MLDNFHNNIVGELLPFNKILVIIYSYCITFDDIDIDM